MIGSSQGGQPTTPQGTRKGGFDTTYGYGSQSAWHNAGAPKSAPQPAPMAAPAAAPAPQQTIYSQSSIRPPHYISDDATENSVNNTIAQGYASADPRFQMKQLDRQGFSRGKGAQYIAGQQGVQEMGKAADQAAQTRAQDQTQNSQMRSDYEQAREQEAQSTAMSAFQMQQADWARQFAQQQAAAQLMQALMTSGPQFQVLSTIKR